MKNNQEDIQELREKIKLWAEEIERIEDMKEAAYILIDELTKQEEEVAA